MSATVAALFVLPDGPYASLPDVDLWPEARDARLYNGPYPVVAHPPCERWGRYWNGGTNMKARRRKLGDDAGCFASALASVRRWSGVLEHPEASHAWGVHGLPAPPRWGGWVADLWGGWSCCVEQGHYGHQSRKPTWLYFVGHSAPHDLVWGPSEAAHPLTIPVGVSREERRRMQKRGTLSRLSRRKRKLSPTPFAEALLALARGAA